ncbi:MAG TPA: hypothetical protein VHU81_09695 [Thermoanaerobaculia bacterium]|nr:hypothetical protein [Thermoanaerobaculia bacterium]
MPTFNIQGRVIKKSGQLGIPKAKVRVFHFGRLAPVAEVETELDGKFKASFAWTETGRPDVYFRVVQVINDVEQVIYNEDPATATRFNIADVLSVTLRADEGLTLTPPPVPQAGDNRFIFTRVGNTGVDQIDSATGYARLDTAATPDSADADAPFGSTLNIAGWFGLASDVQFYKILIHKAGATPQDLTDPVYNTYYESGPPGKPGQWKKISMGPFSDSKLTNYYRLPDLENGLIWIFPDLLAQWDTTRVANGTYKLTVLGFNGKLQPAASLTFNPDSELTLRVDNSAPVIKILGIEHSPSPGDPFARVEVCEIVPFIKGKLRLKIEASDAEGHLRSYSLAAMFGHNLSVTPPPPGASDSYANHVNNTTHHWNGGVFLVDYDGATYPVTKMPTCAYQFRLNAAKRTTNGYNIIFGGEDTVHITLQRPK